MQRSRRLGGTSTAAEVTSGLDLRGKTIVLTGCSSGIGLETFRVLVKRGAHVIGLARNAEKAERASSIARVSDGEGQATALACELEDFRSVVDCAAAVGDVTSHVDALICNAGIEVGSLQRIDGIEKQFVVNHLSHFVLVDNLLGLLRAAPEGRVVVVSSCFAYMRAPPEGIQFANLSGEGGYERDVHMLYAQSKLANVLFSNELARRLKGSTVTSNALHPGYVQTNIARDLKAPAHGRYRALTAPIRRALWRLRGVQIKTLAQGAATTCFVATHPSLHGVSGRYFEDCAVVESPQGFLSDTEMARELWAVSERMTQPFLRPWSGFGQLRANEGSN